MKVIAYLDQFGNETVTPYEAKKRNIKTIYSTHKPGERLEMYVNRRGINHYFAYKSDAEHLGQSAPETLTHTLCKEVIADLASQETITELIFFNSYGPYKERLPVPIKLTRGILEHQIEVGDHKYSIDAYCEFEPPPITDNKKENSSSLLSLYRQWDGKIAFEIFHTHEVDDRKLNDLNSKCVPVFQIGINKKSALFIDEGLVAKMNDKEANIYLQNHREKLAKIFRKRIGGVVLNNPKSPAYLAAQALYIKLSNQNQQLSDQKAEINRLNDELHRKTDEIDAFSQKNARTKLQLDNCQQKCETMQQKIKALVCEKDELEAIKSQLKAENQHLKNFQSKRWLTKIFKIFGKY